MFCQRVFALLLLGVVGLSYAQENAQRRVPESLIECYRNPFLQNRDNRLPMTIDMLIELIQRAENAQGTVMDIRQMAVSLLHRFRADGIEGSTGISTASGVLPFSPTGFQFSKHRILLYSLIPGNARNFPNETLSPQERCTLHFMLSSSIDTRVRGDEGTRCNSLAQYRSMRLPRSTGEFDDGPEEVQGDVEIIPELKYKTKEKRGAMQNEDELVEDEGEVTEPVEEDYADIQGRDAGVPNPVDTDYFAAEQVGTAISQCPVENGVIRTRWGAVAAGPLIAGIAAGLERQQVNVGRLLQAYRSRSGQQVVNAQVDNLFAATLTGDIAEAALLQGPLVGNIQVGGPGSWNSSHVHRWYFLTQNNRNEMTDAEIRGGLDGLILGASVRNWANSASGLRLSQLLDMYYSQRGVFNSATRACNRRELFTSVTTSEEVSNQAFTFTTVLEREMNLRVTLETSAIAQFSQQAAASLNSYIPSTLNDLNCQTTANKFFTDTQLTRTVMTDIIIVVDTTWIFRDIQPAIALLLTNLGISRIGSRYAIHNANDFRIIVNRTQSTAAFHNVTEIEYQTHPTGFHMQRVLPALREHMFQTLNEERTNNSAGGRSSIVLFIPNTGSVSDADRNFALEQIRLLREQAPDLRMLFLGGGTIGRFADFVIDDSRDLFAMAVANDMSNAINPVVERITQTPRRFNNHFCGGNWISTGNGNANIQLSDQVETAGIVFYRVHPNNFFGEGGRLIRVQGLGFGPITVCHSRSMENPRANGTNENSDVSCRQLTSETMDIDISNGCAGHSVIHTCQPLFISIESPVSAAPSTNFRCSDPDCRFPDNIRFNLHSSNFGCFSGVERILGALPLLAAALLALWSISA